MRQRADLEHRRGRPAQTEELVADEAEVHAATDIGHVGGDLDHVVEGPAGVLHQGLHRAEHLAGLPHEGTDMVDGAVRGVGHLASEKEDGWGAGDLDGLAVARRVISTGGAVFLDGGHVVSSRWSSRATPQTYIRLCGKRDNVQLARRPT